MRRKKKKEGEGLNRGGLTIISSSLLSSLLALLLFCPIHFFFHFIAAVIRMLQHVVPEHNWKANLFNFVPASYSVFLFSPLRSDLL